MLVDRRARRGRDRRRRSPRSASASARTSSRNPTRRGPDCSRSSPPPSGSKALEPRLADIDALIDDEVRAIPLDTTIDLELAMGRIALHPRGMGAARRAARAHAGRGDRASSTRGGAMGRRAARQAHRLPPGCTRRAWARDEAPPCGARRLRRRGHRASPGRRATRGDDVLGALLGARPSGDAALTRRAPQPRARPLPRRQRDHRGRAVVGARARRPRTRRVGKVRDDPDVHTRPFLTESLRLTPAVWGIPRTPTRAGITLTAAGVTTRVSAAASSRRVYLRGINRDPNIVGRPVALRPVAPRRPTRRNSSRALLPFGLGPRGCIGQHLAMAEMSAVLPALARRGDITIDGPSRKTPASRFASAAASRVASRRPAQTLPRRNVVMARRTSDRARSPVAEVRHRVPRCAQSTSADGPIALTRCR